MVERKTLADQIVDYVRDRISQNLLQPGQKLTIQGLANELNVSMTPVREAIKTLAAMRLVHVEANKSVIIAQPDAEEVLQLLVLYTRIEALAGELVVATASTEDIEKLRAIADLVMDSVRRNDRIAYFHANQDFHLSMVKLSGNQPLIEVHQNLNARLYPFRFRGISRESGAWKELAAEHYEIVEALVARDAERIARLLQHHSRGARDILIGEMESLHEAEAAKRTGLKLRAGMPAGA